MADPIEEFLRRAAQQRYQQPQEEIIDAEVMDDIEILEPDIISGQTVEGHVAQQMGTSTFDQRAATMGQHVDRADDRMEAHLQQVFQHDLGRLGAPTTRPADSILDDDSELPPQEAPPLDLATLLKTPQNLRHAIILNEILKRPEELW